MVAYKFYTFKSNRYSVLIEIEIKMNEKMQRRLQQLWSKRDCFLIKQLWGLAEALK